MPPQLVTLTSPSGKARARVLAGFGFNCFDYQMEAGGSTYDVLWSLPNFESGELRPSSSGIPILFPFPGRVRRGELTWDGQSYALPLTDRQGNAIHGFVHNRPWRVVAQSAHRVSGEFQASIDDASLLQLWPADFKIAVTYELHEDRLVGEFRVTNPDSKPLPWGLGTHPYFRLPGSTPAEREQCRLVVPVSQAWELVDMNATGARHPLPPDVANALQQGAPLAERVFDNVFTGLLPVGGPYTARLEGPQLSRSVQIEFSAPMREIVVFTPPHREAVCIEPYTCAPDPFRLQSQGVDAGLNVLPPGESTDLRIVVRIA